MTEESLEICWAIRTITTRWTPHRHPSVWILLAMPPTAPIAGSEEEWVTEEEGSPEDRGGGDEHTYSLPLREPRLIEIER